MILLYLKNDTGERVICDQWDMLKAKVSEEEGRDLNPSRSTKRDTALNE